MRSYHDRFLNDKKPICAICYKEVEKFTVFNDIQKYEVVFVAECHGDKESYPIDSNFFMETSIHDIHKGYAFNKKHLDQTLTIEAK